MSSLDKPDPVPPARPEPRPNSCQANDSIRGSHNPRRKGKDFQRQLRENRQATEFVKAMLRPTEDELHTVLTGEEGQE